MGSGNLRKFGVSLKHWLLKLICFILSPTFLSAICLIIFLTSLTLFYHRVATIKMDEWTRDKWRESTFAFGIIFVFLFETVGVKRIFQRQFLLICRWVIALTYIIKLGVLFLIISYPYWYLLSLDVGTLFATIVIIILAIRHDLFND